MAYALIIHILPFARSRGIEFKPDKILARSQIVSDSRLKLLSVSTGDGAKKARGRVSSRNS